MYDRNTRLSALELIQQGRSLRSVSITTGISRATLRDWLDHPARAQRVPCPRCEGSPSRPEPPESYAYLLGLYLGDGCISPAGDGSKRVWALHIMCADAWPGLLQECQRAMRTMDRTMS